MNNQNFVSTGKKILRHLYELLYFQKRGIIKTLSLQIAPTSRCNLNCVFCSNVNRAKHEDLLPEQILDCVKGTSPLAIEWTGGGDPTKYEYINELTIFFHHMEIKQGFITNGIELMSAIKDVNIFDWIRVSLNSLDYVKDIDLPKDYKGTLGFSYVINPQTDQDTFARLRKYAETYNPAYIRVVPNCQTTAKTLEDVNRFYSKIVRKLGPPFFYQEKVFTNPKRCWWGYFKPFLLHDGYIYPCSSVVLNETADRSFHEKFRWMTIDDFINYRHKKADPFDSKYCTNCVFGEQNALIEALIDPQMENFI